MQYSTLPLSLFLSFFLPSLLLSLSPSYSFPLLLSYCLKAPVCTCVCILSLSSIFSLAIFHTFSLSLTSMTLFLSLSQLLFMLKGTCLSISSIRLSFVLSIVHPLSNPNIFYFFFTLSFDQFSYSISTSICILKAPVCLYLNFRFMFLFLPSFSSIVQQPNFLIFSELKMKRTMF